MSECLVVTVVGRCRRWVLYCTGDTAIRKVPIAPMENRFKRGLQANFAFTLLRRDEMSGDTDIAPPVTMAVARPGCEDERYSQPGRAGGDVGSHRRVLCGDCRRQLFGVYCPGQTEASFSVTW
jgi:hypothetical protein